MIKCQHCGKRIPYDANVCPYCGRSIKQFQQKDVLEDEEPQEEQAPLIDEEVNNLPPSPQNDRKLLFFIIAVLALLLVVGAIYHYSSVSSDEEEEQTTETRNDSLAADTINLEKPADKVVYNAKKQQHVVVNGEGVRMRYGPSLKAAYLKDEKGATRSVKKGTQLECVGEEGDWYQVVYMGKRYYMSKQFTYLVE